MALTKEEIMVRYWSHFKSIKKIGEYPITRSLKLSDLGDMKTMKAETQKCYNEMKTVGGDITVIEYLCLLSFLFLREGVPETEKTVEKKVRYILKNYNSFKEETNNMMRFLVKKPEFFFLGFGTKNIELYKELINFWCEIYIKQYNQENPDNQII